MNTISHIVFITISFILVSSPTHGEKKETTLNLLRGGTWKDKIEKNGKVSEIGKNFTAKKYIEYVIFTETGRFECQYDYYLSETPDRTFKVEKVGKSKNGKYIISRLSSGEGITYVDEILKLTYSSLKIKRLGATVTKEWERKEKDGKK